MTKDSAVLGLLAGFAGNAIKEIIVWPMHFMGYARYTFVHIAAGFFVPAKFIDDPVSLATGVAADWTMAGFLGFLLIWFIRRTGGDYPVVKGLGFSAIVYLFVYGIGMALNLTRATLFTPLPNLLLLFPHLAFGAVAGWFIGRYDQYEKLS